MRVRRTKYSLLLLVVVELKTGLTLAACLQRRAERIAADAHVLVVVTVADLKGVSWTVQQRCLVAMTLDFVQRDHPAVSSSKLGSGEQCHVVASGEKHDNNDRS